MRGLCFETQNELEFNERSFSVMNQKSAQLQFTKSQFLDHFIESDFVFVKEKGFLWNSNRFHTIFCELKYDFPFYDLN